MRSLLINITYFQTFCIFKNRLLVLGSISFLFLFSIFSEGTLLYSLTLFLYFIVGRKVHRR